MSTKGLSLPSQTQIYYVEERWVSPNGHKNNCRPFVLRLILLSGPRLSTQPSGSSLHSGRDSFAGSGLQGNLRIMAIATPSSIIDCTLVWGSCFHFLQHKRRDQRAELNWLCTQIGSRRKRIETKEMYCSSPDNSAGRTQIAWQNGRGYPV